MVPGSISFPEKASEASCPEAQCERQERRRRRRTSGRGRTPRWRVLGGGIASVEGALQAAPLAKLGGAAAGGRAEGLKTKKMRKY